MAQRAVTMARAHGEKAFRVLIDPSVHPSEHVAEFRKIAGARANAEFAEVEIWTSGEGVTKSKRFRDPSEEKPEEKTPEPPADGEQNSEPQKPQVDASAKTKGEPKSAKK